MYNLFWEIENKIYARNLLDFMKPEIHYIIYKLTTVPHPKPAQFNP